MTKRDSNITYFAGSVVIAISSGAIAGDLNFGWLILGCAMTIAALGSWWKNG